MSSATDGGVIYRDPVADYAFSTFQTTYATEEERWRPHASKTTASLVMAGLIMVGGLSGTTIGSDSRKAAIASSSSGIPSIASPQAVVLTC